MSVQVPPNSTGSVIETYIPATNVLNAGERQSVSIEGSGSPTYSAAYTAQSVGTSATTAVFYIAGSATKTVRLLQMIVSVTVATAGVAFELTMQKESVLPTGGTKATAATIVPWDSADGAATATTAFYTVTPTDGTVTGVMLVEKFYAYITPATTVQPPVTTRNYIFNQPGMKLPTLRGIAQGFVWTLNAATPANATSFDVNFVWSERSGD